MRNPRICCGFLFVFEDGYNYGFWARRALEAILGALDLIFGGGRARIILVI
jgi:hypothetical protein